VAKRVLPIHLDKREREILELVAERDKISMAEVVRRSIRSLAIEVIEPKLDRASAANTNNTAAAAR